MSESRSLAAPRPVTEPCLPRPSWVTPELRRWVEPAAWSGAAGHGAAVHPRPPHTLSQPRTT
jgi:hypothetical protein